MIQLRGENTLGHPQCPMRVDFRYDQGKVRECISILGVQSTGYVIATVWLSLEGVCWSPLRITLARCRKRRTHYNLRKGFVESSMSSILEHLVQSVYVLRTNKTFCVLYTMPKQYPKGLRKRLLKITKRLLLKQPELCKQKMRLQSLTFLWP